MSEPTPTVARPPGAVFRVVKTLSKSSSSTGVYLCLPRTLPSSSEPTMDIDEDLSNRCAPILAAFGKMTGNERLQQQLSLLEYERLGHVLYQNIQENRTSLLRSGQIEMLPQLVVVKMSTEKEKVRREVEVVEEIHRMAGEVTTLHIGSYVLGSQHTEAPETSYMVLRPIFGPTLEEFSERSSCCRSGHIPDWLMAHVCIALIEAVNFLHEHGLVHGRIEASNVMLSLYPVYMHHRYRGYPDVQLINFSDCASAAAKDTALDVRGVLVVLGEIMIKQSDAAPSRRSKRDVRGRVREKQGEQNLLLAQIKSMTTADYEGDMDIQGLQRSLVGIAQDMRHVGPETMPRDIMRLLHADLTTAGELECAVRNPLVLKLRSQKEVTKVVRDDGSVAVVGVENVETKTRD
ncbi:hypothetical protein COCCADRAFT_106832 [Bipolaris zeicola 26-R-13]|uniref:Protein kinase domain-containing protein n=1 Tax=Cochliobolus carbonum (strain 26-R-13) TaxID=930089 RepID=W6XPP8_COCC2|nr:uncharacterized protein COCCADRAFT_106832 [Bipolaris zeicola 26-R-13]EUC29322.1 hypothetical protein COCCADRAFT_106832 [Bipolaris zeicola 26-R-13]